MPIGDIARQDSFLRDYQTKRVGGCTTQPPVSFHFHNFSRKSNMDEDYYDIEAILAENQKIQCTFEVTVPDMGHLDGGSERDVRTPAHRHRHSSHDAVLSLDKTSKQSQHSNMDGIHPYLLV